MLQVHTFVFNDFQENTYIIWDETHECAIIDPGCHTASEQMALSSFIEKWQLKPKYLLNTHCHIDHILGNMYVYETYKIPLSLHEGELFTYKDTDRWAAMFGLPNFEIPEKKIFLEPGESINLGNQKLEVLFSPGHSIASISFYHSPSNSLFSGDVLFYESIGRTDLPGGNFERLEQSIRNVLYKLPSQTIIFSGHGPQTNIGHEKKFNPFVAEPNEY